MDPEKARITVLVVDNDEDFLEEVIETLRDSGYQTVPVKEPMVALLEIERVKPDIVLLDLQMPGKSGLEIGYEMRRRAEFTHTPILAISGIFSSRDIPLPEMWGFKHCLKKPFHPSELICAIEDLTKQTALVN